MVLWDSFGLCRGHYRFVLAKQCSNKHPINGKPAVLAGLCHLSSRRALVLKGFAVLPWYKSKVSNIFQSTRASLHTVCPSVPSFPQEQPLPLASASAILRSVAWSTCLKTLGRDGEINQGPFFRACYLFTLW